MSALIPVILSLLQTIIPAINSSSTIAKIIETLVQIIPIIVTEVQDLVPEVKNVIAALQSTNGITDDQMTQLIALDAKVDSDFEAAVAAANAADDTNTLSADNTHTTDTTNTLSSDHPNAAS